MVDGVRDARGSFAVNSQLIELEYCSFVFLDEPARQRLLVSRHFHRRVIHALRFVGLVIAGVLGQLGKLCFALGFNGRCFALGLGGFRYNLVAGVIPQLSCSFMVFTFC